MDSENFTDVSKVIKTMIVNGCSPNTANVDLETPFYLLLQKTLEILVPSDLVEFFIEKSSIDFHSHNEKEIHKMIAELGLQHKITSENRMNINFINTWTEPEIIQMFENLREDKQTFLSTTGKVLEEAIARDLHETIEILLRIGVDVNEISPNNRFNLPPAFLACALGHFKCLKVLLADSKLLFSSDKLKCNLLHQIFSYDKVNAEDRKKCFKLIVMDRRSTLETLNAQDIKHHSPLYLACISSSHEIVKDLLRRGAYVGEESVIKEIDKEVFEEFLDESVKCFGDVSDKNCEVYIDYKFLVPPKAQKPPVSETATAEFIVENSNLKTLVLHPVISSFLLLKWKRIDFLVYLSLTLYFGFMLYLGFFIINFYKVSTAYPVDGEFCDKILGYHSFLFNGTGHKFYEETCSEYTDYSAAFKTPIRTQNLDHPPFELCFSYRKTKDLDKKIQCFKDLNSNEDYKKSFIDMEEKILMQIEKNSIIYENKVRDETWKSSFRQHFVANAWSYWFCIAGLTILTIYELVQFCNCWNTYFMDLGNFLDVSLIALSFFVLTKNVEVGHDVFKQICAIMILLMAGQSIQSISKVSAFSLSLHMEMLNKVFKTFVKTIAPYLIIISAFGMAFYAINFDENPRNVESDKANKNETLKEEVKKPTSGFAFPFIALINTVKMMLSDFGAVEITEEDRFQGIIFLLFMVFISIVLFNLLNALAISDTNEILKVAEFVEIKKRISTVQTYEKLFIIFGFKYLNIFPRVKSILLAPNQNFDVKFQQNFNPKFNSNDSILIEKIEKTKKFTELNEHKLIFWRSKIVTFNKTFLKKVLEYIKTVQESEADKAVLEESSRDLQKIKESQNELVEQQSKIDEKIEKLLENFDEISPTRSSVALK